MEGDGEKQIVIMMMMMMMMMMMTTTMIMNMILKRIIKFSDGIESFQFFLLPRLQSLISVSFE